LGASAFSCSISDWNPDWDKFIETSWQKSPVYGSAVISGNNNTKINILTEPDLNSEVIGTVPVNETVDITGVSITAGS